MKKTLILVVFAIICNSAFTQKKEVADTTKKKDQNTTIKKDQDAQVVHITPGASGVKRSIGYKFSTIPSDEDPGNGIFRYNNSIVSDVTKIYVDNIDIPEEDQTKWYSTWDDTTGATARGRITIADVEGKVVTVFYFTGVFTDGNGFWRLPVEFVSGVLPFEGSVYYYVFDRIAHKEETGNPNQVSPVIPANPVIPVITVPADTVVVPVTPVTEVIVNPVVPVITVPADTVVVPVIPVTEVVPVNPVTEVVAVNPVVPVIPVRPVKKADTERPDTLINPAVPVNTSERTRLLGPVSRDAVANTSKKVVPAVPEKPVNPVSQTKPATIDKPVNQALPAIPEKPLSRTNPVIQENPVSQPKPSNPVNQTYPVNQGSQNYPLPESNRLPSYQRNVGPAVVTHRKWYRGIIEVGYGLGVSDYGLNNFRFNFINGFKIGNSSLGLGIGYRRYFTENNIAPYLVSKKSEVPVFLDFRTTFTSRKLTPYLALGFGGTANADTTQSDQNALFFTTSGGIWYNVSDRFAVFAGIAYELLELEFSDTNPYTGNYKKNSNSISLNIGIAF